MTYTERRVTAEPQPVYGWTAFCEAARILTSNSKSDAAAVAAIQEDATDDRHR